jgi:hypothetical protein
MYVAELAYYTSAYALCLTGIAFCIHRFIRDRYPADGWNLALLASLTVTTASMTFNSIQVASASFSMAASQVLNMISMAGAVALIAVSPRFASCFGSHRGQRAVLTLTSIVSLLLAPTLFTFVLPLPQVFQTVTVLAITTVMCLSVLYSFAVLAFRPRAPGDRRGGDAGRVPERRWTSTVPALLIVSTALGPLVILNDLFDLPRRLWALSSFPRLLPLFATAWSVVAIVSSIGRGADETRRATAFHVSQDPRGDDKAMHAVLDVGTTKQSSRGVSTGCLQAEQSDRRRRASGVFSSRAGLHLTRDIPAFIVQAGFHLESSESRHVAPFLKARTHCWWGSAFPG